VSVDSHFIPVYNTEIHSPLKKQQQDLTLWCTYVQRRVFLNYEYLSEIETKSENIFNGDYYGAQVGSFDANNRMLKIS
jgi:hypothetical protein